MADVIKIHGQSIKDIKSILTTRVNTYIYLCRLPNHNSQPAYLSRPTSQTYLKLLTKYQPKSKTDSPIPTSIISLKSTFTDQKWPKPSLKGICKDRRAQDRNKKHKEK